jgi:hypothetical protein|nr:MAG TPA: hypothetical protein [Caudoviricetes sp.]DAS61127.1 MAG TPA: hypothetical protein [Caudoviricetes sp.]DAS89373.1 MAG TPA: hypothetical protein [Caudoviricetes sp.]
MIRDMKASIVNLDEQTAEVLRTMLDPGYLSERIERLEAIEDFLIDQWRDAGTIKPETALTFLDTLRSLRRDLNAFLTSVDPHGEADKS